MSEDSCTGTGTHLADLFINSLTDGIICIDESGMICLVNEYMRKLLGLSDADPVALSQESFLQYFNRLDIRNRENTVSLIRDIWKERRKAATRIKISDTDSGNEWVELQTSELDGGGKKVFCNYFRTISRWKETEEDLEVHAEKLRLIFQYAYDAILIYELIDDYPTQFTEANATACTRLGYTEEEILSLSLFDLVPPSDLGRISANLKQLRIEPEQAYKTEQVTITGAIIPVEVHARLVRVHNRDFIIEISRDVTDRTKLTELRQKALDQIGQNMEQFACLNDQIRNPLGVIAGLACLNESPMTGKILDQVQIINKLVDELDRGWIESEKVRTFLRKHVQ